MSMNQKREKQQSTKLPLLEDLTQNEKHLNDGNIIQQKDLHNSSPIIYSNNTIKNFYQKPNELYV